MSSFLRTTAVVFAGLFAPGMARADNYTWTNAAGGNWNIEGNWNPSGIPVAGDNATISLDPPGASPYGVTVNGAQAIHNLTVASPDAVVHVAGTLNVSGTVVLTRGGLMLGAVGQPATINGGTITRGSTGTGTLSIFALARLTGVTVDGAALHFHVINSPLLRLDGGSNFTPGSVVTFPAGGGPYYPSDSGIYVPQTVTLDNVSITTNLGNVTIGTGGGNTLTLGPNFTFTHNDAELSGQSAYVGSYFFEPGVSNTLINRGTIRDQSGELVIGRKYQGNAGDMFIENHGLIESRFSTLIYANQTFVNHPGGVVRRHRRRAGPPHRPLDQQRDLRGDRRQRPHPRRRIHAGRDGRHRPQWNEPGRDQRLDGKHRHLRPVGSHRQLRAVRVRGRQRRQDRRRVAHGIRRSEAGDSTSPHLHRGRA